ncbi:retinal pigment epithelial membrane family protein [Mycobacterium kansasii]|uniref:Dioxygenase n=1 Tax=Mycobacterium kansasii TaxID=1768 RepID=A0A1V3WVM0_MYCKA|nr:retinal pigment epithelial membrane family protein [Mycobacterium kansasii]
MKDASSTDVIVHRGIALTSFYQCGDLYRLDPYSGNTLGKETWNGHFPFGWAYRLTPRSTGGPASCCSSTTASKNRICTTASSTRTTSWHTTSTSRCRPAVAARYGVHRKLRHSQRFPAVLGSRLLEHNVHLPRFYPDMPSRFAVIPRRGLSGDIRWFEAEPTFVLHFTNAYEDGDEIVLDGFYEADPQPLDTGGTKWEKLFRFLALDRLQTGYTGGASTWSPAP